MMQDDKEFQKMLQETFKVEAEENLNTLSSNLIEIEKNIEGELRDDQIEEAFRAAHSLKGAARAVSFVSIESLCHAAEDVLSALKQKKIHASTSLCDLLNKFIDKVRQALQDEEIDNKINDSETVAIVNQLISIAENNASTTIDKKIEKKDPAQKRAKKSQPSAESSIPKKESLALTDTVRISTAKLDTLLFQVEELLSVKLASAQRKSDIENTIVKFNLLLKEKSKVYPSQKKLQRMFDKNSSCKTSEPQTHEIKKLLDFLFWEDDFLKLFDDSLKKLMKSANHDERLLNSKIDCLMDDMKKALMQPIATTLKWFPKLVRDISHELGKNVCLIINDEESEIDRRILEEIQDPLIHIVRNCIDHGIETPEVRKQVNKPERATIQMAIKQREGGSIEITIADDGAGIDLEKLHAKALKQGLISQENFDECTKDELLPLIFRSGLSTSAIITDISGRGLGLAIVWEKIEKLGGNIYVDTDKGKGTTFHLILPLTLATFRGVYIRVGDQLFLLPTAQVVQCLRLPKTHIKSIENKKTISWQQETIALVALSRILEIPLNTEDDDSDFVQLLILGPPGNRIAFCVDEIQKEEDVLVKNLNEQLLRVRNISGATLVGNGKVVPILNVADLLQSAIKIGASSMPITAENKADNNTKKSIVIAEDSITSRTLLKNILESAGYNVTTAVDGQEALTTIQNQSFDLVMSDVDMPRMNGFELTERIRSDKSLEHLPVVLVTALDSQQDRERGVNAGASAYMVKSSFDQTNLLEIVRRLI